ncbi:MAG: hypothetical protein MJH10_21000, partial [Epibacterium sp.]|nr:hypothetical protein [Epibacterium sp.]
VVRRMKAPVHDDLDELARLTGPSFFALTGQVPLITLCLSLGVASLVLSETTPKQRRLTSRPIRLRIPQLVLSPGSDSTAQT